ncbi:MAG: phenylalanine--tRNA ligase subunit alpha [Rickettsiales bacterium]|jgi:phenylalanyl-tRNA synthetase alpha chain|nr:phenylalanine--tRNA ligase subunit alpha [Rickettsiales bacterium]
MKKQIKNIDNLADLQLLHTATFGKNGTMTARLKEMKNLDMDARAALNAENSELRELFRIRQAELENAEILSQMARNKLDSNLDILRNDINYDGVVHPLTRAISEMTAVFDVMGYVSKSGPEIETDWYNFTALNTPDYHPARDMQDTFWTSCENVLRTQTSAVQIREMEKLAKSGGDSLKIIAPGVVYRSENPDATHGFQFRQVEGLNIGKNITLVDLVSDLKTFLQNFFGRELNMRIRPSYFPFTEPSVEYDIEWKTGVWLELGGAGMVHPNVLKNCGLDPDKIQGYAFGFGWDRLAMMKYGLTDLRRLYNFDPRWIKNKTDKK